MRVSWPIPLFFISFLLLLAGKNIAQQQVTFRGNKFTISRVDTIKITDPVTGAEETQLIPPRPVLINGARIYPVDTLKNLPSFNSKAGESEKLSTHLFYSLKKYFDSLDDGNYILSVTNAVIDKKGKLVYYDFGGIRQLTAKTVFAETPGRSVNDMDKIVTGILKDTSKQALPRSGDVFPGSPGDKSFQEYNRIETIENEPAISPPLKQAINATAQKLLDNLPLMKPARLNGVNVNCTGSVFSTWNYIIVKGHKAIFTPFYDSL